MADGKMSQDDIDAMLDALGGGTPAAPPAPTAPTPTVASSGPMSQDDIDAMLSAMGGEPAVPVAPSDVDIARMAKEALSTPTQVGKPVVGQDEINAVMAGVDTRMLAAAVPPAPVAVEPKLGDGSINQSDLNDLLSALDTGSAAPAAAPAKSEVPIAKVTPASDAPMGQDDIDALLAQMGEALAPAPVVAAPVAVTAAPAGNGQMGQDDIDALLANMTGEPAAVSPLGKPSVSAPAAADDLNDGPLDQNRIDALLAQLGAGTEIKVSGKPTAAPGPVPAKTPAVDPRQAATQPLPQITSSPNAMTMALSNEDLESLVAKHATSEAKPASDTMIAQADIDALVQQLGNATGGNSPANEALGQALAKHEAAIDELLGEAKESDSDPADAVTGPLTARAKTVKATGPAQPPPSALGGWHGPVMAPPEIKGARWLLMAAVLLLGVCAATLVAVTAAVHRLTGELKAERVAQLTTESGEFADDYQSALALIEDADEERRAKGEQFLTRLKKRYPAHSQELSLVLARHFRIRQAWRPAAREFAEVIEGARHLLDDPRIYLDYAEVLDHIGDRPAALRTVYLPLANEAAYTGDRDQRRALRPAREAAANRVTLQECQLLLGRLLGEPGGPTVAAAPAAGHAPAAHGGGH
jgi:hypothetical protein